MRRSLTIYIAEYQGRDNEYTIILIITATKNCLFAKNTIGKNWKLASFAIQFLKLAQLLRGISKKQFIEDYLGGFWHQQ